MQNKVQCGDVITVTAPAAVASGQGVLVGSIFGIAVYSAASGAQVEIDREGVFVLPKAGSQAWTAGVKVYWDNTNGVCTTTSTSNTLIGAATVAAGSSDATGYVLLDAAIH